jgi:hypothetical protein
MVSAKIVPLTPGNLYFFWGMRSSPRESGLSAVQRALYRTAPFR